MIEPKPKKPEGNKEYESLLKDFSNVANALGLYPPGHPMAEAQLKKLFEKISEIFNNEEAISIHHGEGVFIVNEKQSLTTTQAMEKLIRHFNNFKITDLEITKGITQEELREFLQILCHSEESSKMYPDLNTACAKNQITHFHSLQAAYIRVSKDVKDKMGGKSVGELKISTEEMGRLVSYLKGEINLNHPSETKIYQKVFANADLISGLIDKIIVEAKEKSNEEKQKMVIVVLNQVGKYLAQDSTNATRQKHSLEIINALQKALSGSQTVLALDKSNNLQTEIKQTVERVKSLVKNQALVAEYTKHQEKLAGLEAKIQKISPEILEGIPKGTKDANELKKLLLEIKNFLEKIKLAKNLSDDDIKKIDSLLEAIEKI